MDQYYRILGLKPGARKEEVKRAYRRLAKRYHPDVNPQGEKQFLLIRQAYEYLLDVQTQNNFTSPNRSHEEMEAFKERLRQEAERKAREELHRRAQRFREKREEQQNKEYTRAIYTLIALVILFFTVRWSYRWYYSGVVSNNEVQTFAVVEAIGQNRVTYRFFDMEDNEVVDKEYVSNNGIEMMADNGMPLKIGDVFLLRFNSEKPDYHLVDYDKVSHETLERYFELAEHSLLRNLESEDISINPKIYIRCMVLLVYQKEGIDGLAKIYHAHTNPLESLSYNRWTWTSFKNSDVFQEIQKSCQP